WTVISKDHAVTAFASGNTPEVGRYTTLMDVTPPAPACGWS
ncbi:UNVERIFIED_ORG: hypothetical protein ABIB13_002731, partial [Arthrobacter sp. UYEF2]